MNQQEFVERAAALNLTRAGQAIALLWFYRHNQLFDERSVSDLASDLQAAGLGRPNVTSLRATLQRSRETVRGRRPGTFQINVRYVDQLNRTYEPLLNTHHVAITSSVLNADAVRGTRRYLEKIFDEINGCYDYQFYDGSAVLLRRLLEMLIIEAFVHAGDANHIKNGNQFMGLDILITRISGYGNFHLSRNATRTMLDIKELGDNAAHGRTYLTQKVDIDDIKAAARRLIDELLILAGIIR